MNKMLKFAADVIALLVAIIGLFKAISAENASLDAQKRSKSNEEQITQANARLDRGLLAIRGNDVPYEITQTDRDKELSRLLSGRSFKEQATDGPDHINTFFQNPSSTGLKATTLKEAWVMAYIEKHMLDFTYNGKPIYSYGNSAEKRDAIISLVKEGGVDKLFEKIAPLKNSVN